VCILRFSNAKLFTYQSMHAWIGRLPLLLLSIVLSVQSSSYTTSPPCAGPFCKTNFCYPGLNIYRHANERS
ncbi:unnamed protein product, partial [Amoebophrya sp. A120]